MQDLWLQPLQGPLAVPPEAKEDDLQNGENPIDLNNQGAATFNLNDPNNANNQSSQISGTTQAPTISKSEQEQRQRQQSQQAGDPSGNANARGLASGFPTGSGPLGLPNLWNDDPEYPVDENLGQRDTENGENNKNSENGENYQNYPINDQSQGF